MKIICVGQNYREHNRELGSKDPEEPVIFMKPESAKLHSDRPFFIPEFSNELHYETEIIIRINRLGRHIAPKFAHRYYDEVGLGIDFTARDLQSKLKAEGKPWELSKAFDGSAVISSFIPKSRFEDIQNIDFHLNIDGNTVQRGNTADMIFPVDELIAFISRFFTLKMGDIIFTGTPAGVGPVAINNRLEGFIGEQKMFAFNVK